MMKNNIPRWWQTKKLGELCDVIAGQSPEGKFYNKSKKGLPFYQGKKEFGEKFIGEPKTWTTKITKEAQSGDILMSVRAPVGPVNFSTEKICIGRGLAAIKIGKDIDKDFLFNFLQMFESKIIGNAGAVFNSINKYQIKNIEIPLPPLPEQKCIVKILDEAFEKIEKGKENTERNLKNSKELFESYLQNVFANDVAQKNLGDKNLFQIIDGDRGKNYPKKTDFYNEGYCLFLNTKNVRPNGFSLETKMFITEAKDNLLGNGKLKRNDVLLTTRGTIGNIAVYDENVPFENIRINSGMLIFRPNTKLITPEYLFAVFQSGIMKSQIKQHVSGAAQPQLPIKTLVNFSIPVPKSVSEQKSIVKKLDALSEQTKKLEGVYKKKLADLDELRKSVLKSAFAGKY